MEDEDKLILWLKENFVYLISGLLLGLAVILGTNFYQSSQVNLQHELSLQYQKTLRFYKTGDFDRYLIEAKKISDDNPDNIYAAMLNLYSAKYYHDQNMLDEAEKSLLFIVNNSSSLEYKYIALIRLARINISQEKFDDAVNNLNSISKKDDPLVLELLGDIMLFKNDKVSAINYYELALMQQLTPNKSKLIESKLSSIR
tara:strand:- start:278 stop:877 length:600 start_codon:yes stop_codon:yes gene_type:complete